MARHSRSYSANERRFAADRVSEHLNLNVSPFNDRRVDAYLAAMEADEDPLAAVDRETELIAAHAEHGTRTPETPDGFDGYEPPMVVHEPDSSAFDPEPDETWTPSDDAGFATSGPTDAACSCDGHDAHGEACTCDETAVNADADASASDGDGGEFADYEPTFVVHDAEGSR